MENRNININENIMKAIKEALDSSLIKKCDLAKKLHIHKSLLSKYGKTVMPPLSNFALLCKELDVSADEILNIKPKDNK